MEPRRLQAARDRLDLAHRVKDLCGPVRQAMSKDHLLDVVPHDCREARVEAGLSLGRRPRAGPFRLGLPQHGRQLSARVGEPQRVQGCVQDRIALADAVPLGAGRDDARAWFGRAYGMIEDVRAKALANLGMSGARRVPRDELATAGTSADGSFTAVSGLPSISVALEQGETLPAFAQRTMGDPDRWPELLELNQMASPFAGPDGAPLTAGLVLRVPALDGIAGTSAPELFGVDLQMDDDDALVLDGTTDLALVRGPANLNQALRRRLLARRGENLAFPQWGMPALVGEGAVGGTAAYVAAETRAQMLRDNRIRTVTRVNVTREGGVFVVSFDAKTADGGTIPVVAPFPT